MFPSECLLQRCVRSYGDDEESLAATDLPLFILKCKDRKAEGYADDKFETYNEKLKDMNIGVHLADKPPAASYLAILGGEAQLLAEIVAVDKTVIVISLQCTFQGGGSLSYLIYDAVALSLRMIPAPAPEDPSWQYILSSSVSVARPCSGPDYALVHMGWLVADAELALFLWRPSSSAPPWSVYKKAALPYWSVNTVHTEFSFNGQAYWVNLLRGGFCFSCDALFDDNSSVVKFGGFIPLPVEPRGYDVDDRHMAEPAAYRTMGVVRDSFIRFVSIDGFEDYVKLKKRTVTVWKLLGHDEGWEKENELSLQTLWGFEGFGDVPKNLTPMYPLLSTNDTDVIYMGLGGYRETKIVGASLPPAREFFPFYPSYMLAVDMRNKIVRTALPQEDRFSRLNGLFSCCFSQHLRKALVDHVDDDGVPSP